MILCVTARHDPNDMHPDEVTVQEMKRALTTLTGIQVIDVREEDEWRIAKVEGTTLLPLSQLAGGILSWIPINPTTCTARQVCDRQGFGIPQATGFWGAQECSGRHFAGRVKSIPACPLTNSEKWPCLGPRTSINQSTRAMGLRREARERAVQFLFQHDMNPVVTEDLPHHLNHFWETHQLSESGYEKERLPGGVKSSYRRPLPEIFLGVC